MLRMPPPDIKVIDLGSIFFDKMFVEHPEGILSFSSFTAGII